MSYQTVHGLCYSCLNELLFHRFVVELDFSHVEHADMFLQQPSADELNDSIFTWTTVSLFINQLPVVKVLCKNGSYCYLL